jgi:hypothetical protein
MVGGEGGSVDDGVDETCKDEDLAGGSIAWNVGCALFGDLSGGVGGRRDIARAAGSGRSSGC